MPLLRERVYTIEEIYALPEGERAELIDGHIYYMAPPNTMHQRISSILSRKIGNYIESNKGKCEVFAAPFVEVGSTVNVGDVVCIIEAMKMMNEIKAPVSGQIIEILAKNEGLVEYDQTIMLIKEC